MKHFWLKISLSLVVCVAVGSAIAASVSGDTVTINEVVAEDLYVAGETVDVQARVDGDLVIAGRNLVLGARVNGDVLAAGEMITLAAPVTDDVRMTGRRLEVNDLVGGHLVAAGDVLRLGPDADVTDWAWLAGRDITIEGAVGPGSRLAGRAVTISGTVNGDLTVYTRQLILTPTASINGNLTIHTANDPQIDDNARITGEISVRIDPEQQPDPEWSPGFGLFGALLATVTAVVVYLLFPNFMVTGADRLRASPFKSLGLGLLTLILTPLIVMLLFATGLGAVLGLALLAFYLLMLLLGTVTGSVFLASLGLRLTGKDESAARTLSAIAVALAVIVVQVIQMIPVAGSLLTLVLFLAGFGAAVATVWRRYRTA
ncbi:polymer-forming cytoskeletal protein [Saccharospirillum impatiens]|uniref:polymer-forming cytoskeletal protein n=1 Tax=Saccharospirillum impatiens TaxID=169438 RepID=UPI00041DC770|nr:polymer-forming cytoskeletal protein [Saccharospirillum impatiens]